jgi:hypothetical protein
MTDRKDCIYCRKSVSECEKDDKKLITTVNWFYSSPTPTAYWNLHRYEQVAKYKLGCYNSSTDRFYYYNHNVTKRLRNDTYISLPMCVWSNQVTYSFFIRCKQNVITDNLFHLPIQEDYITILTKLATHDIWRKHMQVLLKIENRM